VCLRDVYLTIMLSLAVSAIVLARAVLGFSPTISGHPQVLGLVQDPTINRDSCGSTLFGKRALWVCLDSQPFNSDGVLSYGLGTSE
jgi:hypothetical protein